MADIEKIKQDLAEVEQTLRDLGDKQSAFAQKMRVEALVSQCELQALLGGSGAIAQGDGTMAVGQDGIGVGGNIKDSTLIKGDNNRVNQTTNIYNGSSPVKTLLLGNAMQKYLDYLIAHHQYLQLQGIRAGSHPLSVALEKVYISLSILDKHQAGHKTQSQGTENFHSEPGVDTVVSSMHRYRRLVIIGDPGSGKTTLLAYLTLTYARDLRDADGTVKSRLRLDKEDGYLPITLPLRALGYHLRDKNIRSGNAGAALLLDYLNDYYLAQNIALPEDFFVDALDQGKAVLLLDGMDEVADVQTRQSVARLIEAFAARYSKARFVVTSREMGYEGAARIGAEFGLAKVRDFSPAEVRRFVKDWTRVIETTFAQSIASPKTLGDEDLHAVIQEADNQSDKLIQAIDNNVRVAELAVNPLLLTVIALVHRYRAQLPERRSELYEEAVEVLLGHWDSAKGLEDELDVAGIRMDSGDRRSFLEPVAFWMHERNQREIELADLRDLLLSRFKNMTGDTLHAEKAVDAFLRVINERSGLLIARGIGVYGFAHLTFQEYLVARALADRKDALEFTLKHLSDTWWREVILLQAGYLSTQGKRRVSELIGALMNADLKTEPEPHHHLLLAVECLFDVGMARADGNLLEEARRRLKTQAEAPIEKRNKASLLSKLTAMNALARLDSGKIDSQFWKAPWGEPEWVTIPAGEFWMGGEGWLVGKLAQKLTLPEYQIARVPITNAQYALYVQDAKAKAPDLTAADLDAAVRTIAGSARSMGITVEGV